MVQIFLQAPVVPGHDGCRLQPHIADVPGLSDEAGDLLLLCGVADHEAVLVAVRVQPFLLLRPGEADAGACTGTDGRGSGWSAPGNIKNKASPRFSGRGLA